MTTYITSTQDSIRMVVNQTCDSVEAQIAAFHNYALAHPVDAVVGFGLALLGAWAAYVVLKTVTK